MTLRNLVRSAPAALLLLAASCAHGPRPQRLPTTVITLGARTIRVEVASTTEQRAMGMMFRRSLKPDEGMLFVFPRDDNLDFYMKNTYVPLSVAFIRSDGIISDITDMEPLTLDEHLSRTACRYALEMPRGWFSSNGVAEGAQVKVPQDIPAQ